MNTATQPRLILVVDDDPDMREALGLLLETRGYRVTSVGNGAEALTTLRAGTRPCVIVLDLMMPVKNGFEFCAEQRLDTELANIPVVVLSALSGSNDYAPLPGVAAHLQKPLSSVGELLHVIEQCSHQM